MLWREGEYFIIAGFIECFIYLKNSKEIFCPSYCMHRYLEPQTWVVKHSGFWVMSLTIVGIECILRPNNLI